MKNTFMPEKFRPLPNGAELIETGMVEESCRINSCLFIYDESKVRMSICIGPRNDMVLQTIERNIIDEKNIILLFLEDMHQTWSMFCRDGNVFFIIKNSENTNVAVQPERLYFRSGFSKSDSKYSENLFNVLHLLDLWQGEILCRPMEHRLNNSKLLQSELSVIPVARQSHGLYAVPDSYVVKGIANLDKLALDQVVVKSLSGIRSDVIDQCTFMRWDKSSVNHLPILFQQIIEGEDIRVHSLNNEFYAKKITRKVYSSSYRYRTRDDQMSDYPLNSEMKSFCGKLIDSENLNLAGIDFMLGNDGTYYCFEINPGPGWSAYHENDDISKSTFLSQIMDYLKNEKI